MLKSIYQLLVAVSISLSIVACNGNTVIDEQSDIQEGLWHLDSLVAFQFEIEDTTSSYQIQYNVRYAVNYPYYNLFLKYYLEDSTGEILSSELQELILFDKKTGEPMGEGLGDLFDRGVPVFEDQKFSNPGAYTFKVKQFMRMEQLPGILSFGLKIQKPEESE
ncbi:gliding motility-associated lipoprotein GldH [Reichenbachiella faecimaris]|uniref:Gliding motility-associated lipoprotein GldH n=1 Tax=Reichenbachiella faecimaris TaxID=692418 RepID=A0A1W2GD14_REIFA|nr:gliding motility lipoprotein GldH [Reichenbachiella faecimaris]SMD34404.1 gliding motility-associated lipoprotein GldH [Reichenbachiella faecimaris]